MTLIQLDINKLKSLSCFSAIIEIRLITEGMSHTCFEVTTAEQVLLAKKLNHDTAITEVIVSNVFSNSGLSPTVIYQDNEWLVTQFIVGSSLTKSALDKGKKLSTALTLMAKLHQLLQPQNNKSFPILDTTKSVNRLFTNPATFTEHDRIKFVNTTEFLTNNINAHIARSSISSVICHGDLNYTNILLDTKDKPWLIDFECAHLAPVEFDLGMFIAVNNISPDHISELITTYTALSPNYQPNNTLLTYYILYSYFINGLWYLDNMSLAEAENPLRTLAIEQWSAFDNFAIVQSITLPKLLPLIR